MITRELQILILGDIPEVGNIFERPLFQEELPVSPIFVRDKEQFEAKLEQDEIYDLVLIDIQPYGIEVLDRVREHRPACPIIMIADPNEVELVLEAKRKSLDAYLLRGIGDALFTDLLAEEIYTLLTKLVEPPTMQHPSADEMYRYAQFHNVLEPFFFVALKRYLLYANRVGQELIAALHDQPAFIGAPVEEWSLTDSAGEFTQHLDRAFAGHEMVHEQEFDFPTQNAPLLRELHYQPVTDPRGRVVGVSIAVHQPDDPQLQRVQNMQQIRNLAAAVSHENNNLLTVLQASTTLLSDRLTELNDADSLAYVAKIERGIERSVHFSRQLQSLSQTNVSQPEPINLNRLIRNMQATLNSYIPSHIHLNTEFDAQLPDIHADPGQWETVLTNLVRNCVRGMVDGGIIQLRTDTLTMNPATPGAPVGPGDYVVLELHCDHHSLLEKLGDRNLAPLFLAHREERYAGLELATVKSIVEQKGGRISTVTNDGRTIVRIYYPQLKPSQQPENRSRGAPQ